MSNLRHDLIRHLLNFGAFDDEGFWIDCGPSLDHGIAISSIIVVEITNDGETVGAWEVEAERWDWDEAARMLDRAQRAIELWEEDYEDYDEEYERNYATMLEVSCHPDGLTASEARDILYDY